MKTAAPRRLFAIGVALVFCFPLLAAGMGLYSYALSKWVYKSFYASAFVEQSTGSIEDLNRAIQPGSPNVEITPVRNTDLIQVGVHAPTAQEAVDKANSVAQAIQEKFNAQKPEAIRIKVPATDAMPPPRPLVFLNMVLGGFVGFFPAVVGAVLILVARNRMRPPSVTTQPA